MKFFSSALLCLLLIISLVPVQAQKWVIESETGAIGGIGGKVPFGLQRNQWGEVPAEGPTVYQRFRLRDTLQVIHASRPNVRIQYGLSTALNLGLETGVRVSAAYVGLRAKSWGLRVGRWREVQGIVDTTQSSGSFTWSGNALPIPRIEFGLQEYTPVFGSSLFAVKGFLAHGWFDNGAVEGSWLHQKSAYLRVGKPQWNIAFYAGVNHQVQWGGRPSEPFTDPLTGDLITQFPSGWRDFVNVAAGLSLNRNEDGLSQPGVPANEALNRAGNHLGGVDVGIQMKVKGGRILLYKQSYFEDGSLFYLTNIQDGLYGFSYRAEKSQRLKHVTVEFLYTLNQGGEGSSTNNVPQLRGRDNYFNNSLYLDGWTYRGRTIGHPFIMTKENLSEEFVGRPVNPQAILSNRVTALNFQAAYSIRQYPASTQVFHIRSLGLYGVPRTGKMLGLVQSFQKGVGNRGGSIRVRGSLDLGTLVPTTFGLDFSYILPLAIY